MRRGRPSSLRAALQSTGYPWAGEAATPLEEARVFLRAGAEIEHALLVEYLYAAWSAPSALTGRVTEIAIQEMCHLITVQNLLRFIGAAPHLGRQDQDPIDGVDPFPFSLRPFAKSVSKILFWRRCRPSRISAAVTRRRWRRFRKRAVRPIRSIGWA